MKRVLALATLLATTQVHAEQAPLDFLGVALGAPLSFPECNIVGSRKYPTYQSTVTMTGKPCWRHDILGPKPGTPITAARGGVVRLAFPSDDVPQGVHFDRVEATIVDGNVEEITAITRGRQYQQGLLDSLRQKYGEPAVIDRLPLSNAMGATVESITANWTFDNLSVQFSGIGTRVDNGIITVRTPRGDQHRAQVRARDEAERPKF